MGVSLDQEENLWKEAIVKDDLPWFQISDLKFWNNEIARAYYIRSLPANFLLDKTGTIIEKNVDASKLTKLLLERLK